MFTRAHASTSTSPGASAPVGARYLPRPAQSSSGERPADASVLRAALSAAGSSIAALARACGVCDTRAGAWASGEASISLRHLLAAPASVRREIALLLSDDGSPPTRLAPLEHVARLAAEAGDVARAAIEAGSEIDDEERARLDRELAELGAAVERARRDLRTTRAA